MAVYEKTYRPYVGELTPEWERFAVIPRYAMRTVFRSKLFIAFFVACFIYPLGCAAAIYLMNNLDKLAEIGIPVQVQGFSFGPDAVYIYLWIQAIWPPFIMALLLGPSMVSADMRNNGLSLYLSRPTTRTEYIAGKFLVLFGMLSAITWVPGLLLFWFQTYYAGFAWAGENFRLAAAVVFGSVVWIVLLSLISLAISAYVKWKTAARAAMLLLFLLSGAMGTAMGGILSTAWTQMINIPYLMARVWTAMLGTGGPTELPLWAAWTALLAICAASVWVLYRRVRAYEVVR